MWVLTLEFVSDGEAGERKVELVHSDSIIRACHLAPRFGDVVVPNVVRFSDNAERVCELLSE